MPHGVNTLIEGTDENQRQLFQYMKSLIDQAEEERRVHEDLWQENFNNYNSVSNRMFYQGRANLHVPISNEMVETLVVRIKNSIFGTFPNFSVVPKGDTPEQLDDAMISESWLAWDLKKMRFKKKTGAIFRIGEIVGVTIGKLWWRHEESKRIQLTEKVVDVIDPETKKTIPNDMVEGENIKDIVVTEKEVNVVDYDGNEVTVINPWSVWVDELTPDNDIQKSRFVLHRDMKTFEDLKNLYGDDMPDDFLESGEATLEENDQNVKRSTGSDAENEEKLDPKMRLFQHDELWFDWNFDNDVGPAQLIHRNSVGVIVGDRQLVRAQKNPFWHGKKPFMSYAPVPNPVNFYSQASSHHTRKLQYEINDTRNQSMDLRSRSLNMMFLVGRAAGIKDKQIVIRQGGIIRANDIRQVQPLPIQTQALSAAREVELQAEDNMRSVSGATRALQGTPLSTVRSATEFAGGVSGGQIKTEDRAEEFIEQWYMPQLEMSWSNIQQFTKTDRKIQMLKDLGFGTKAPSSIVNVGPEDLVGDINLIVEGPQENALEGAKGSQFLQFAQMMLQLDPEMQVNRNLLQKIIHKVWTKVFRLDPIDFAQLMNDVPLTEQVGVTLKSIMEKQSELEKEAANGGTENPSGSQQPLPNQITQQGQGPLPIGAPA